MNFIDIIKEYKNEIDLLPYEQRIHMAYTELHVQMLNLCIILKIKQNDLLETIQTTTFIKEFNSNN